MRLLLRLLLVATAIYAGACVLAFVLQRRLLYFPDRYPEEAARARAAKLGLAQWGGGGGAPCGWRAAPEGRAVARLLVLHGNGGSALDRSEYPAALVPLGVEVILLEYPGYGACPGAPSQDTLSHAAADAISRLAQESASPLWLLGESLGSGVAARAVALRPGAVHGLVLVTPFARLTDIVRLHYPFLPSALLRDRFDPAADLADFRGAAAILVAGRDEVVSAAQGRLLFDALPGPKRLYLQDTATHNTLALAPTLPMWGDMMSFLLQAGRR